MQHHFRVILNVILNKILHRKSIKYLIYRFYLDGKSMPFNFAKLQKQILALCIISTETLLSVLRPIVQ